MLKRLSVLIIFILILAFPVMMSSAQDQEEDRGFIFEEEIEAEFLTDLEEQGKEPEPQFIIADILTKDDVEPAVDFYIRDDINRKFSGLITNLKLEKIYGIFQDDKTATIYFDYSYTSLRNRDNVLYEKGKMTFIRFNSDRWFNEELSIYMMDKYTFVRTIDYLPTLPEEE